MLPYATPQQVNLKIKEAVAELKKEITNGDIDTGGSSSSTLEVFNCSEVYTTNGAQQILDAYNAGKKLVYIGGARGINEFVADVIYFKHTQAGPNSNICIGFFDSGTGDPIGCLPNLHIVKYKF